ncbi:hypothetical protein [uncultured Draconibacterium sp.]|uniref:hypothetical protein n=1 Tax=uncultured Draconibacterium sp. TaxID=1573823 RepID=UPI0025DCFA1F|nr:hypothetical protein [uncultured Draconibacterium sp.]
MKTLRLICLFLATLTAFAANSEEKLVWPREIEASGNVITLYQPQLESLNGNMLDGRMAVSIKTKSDDMIFGALWFNATLLTDMEARTADLVKVEIPMIKFPDVEDESKLEQLKQLVIDDMEALDVKMSIDRILADLEDEENLELLNDQLNNNPPEIYYRSEPSVLVIIDGDPIMKTVEKSSLEYVLNTPFLILKRKSDYYLKGGDYWFTASDVLSKNWKQTKSVPKDVKKAADKMMDKEEEPEVEGNDAIPEIIVSSVPAELISSDGKLEYETIKGTSLLFVKNSENDIIMDINSQHHFVLLNGRWFSSKTLADGDWTFVEPDDLPEDFAKIPEDESIATVRASVPGTPEAKEAKYEQQMPQTAVVDRKTASVTVEYDGDPKFEKIEDSEVEYAINTASTVLRIKAKYYCVDDGIWFESTKATGPWIVSDSRPAEVDEIPPSAPVYNVKYVYIYDSTPDVVYVGYTPGYCHSYWYNGSVFYGTGYYYRPWYGSYYYPRPWTFGFGVHYNPYTGWGFNVGFSYGWFHMNYYGGGYGYWGPAGYRHGYRHGYHHGYHHGYRDGYLRGYAGGYANGRYNSRNIYNRRDRGIRSTRDVRNRDMPNRRDNVSSRPSSRPNNVYTDRDGNIMRRDNNGNWQQENKRPSTRPDLPNKSGNTNATRPSTRPTQPTQRPSTRPTQPTQRPSTRPTQPTQRPSARPATRPNTLERDFNSRNRGTTRYNNFQRSRPTTTPRSRPMPARGGGMRR